MEKFYCGEILLQRNFDEFNIQCTTLFPGRQEIGVRLDVILFGFNFALSKKRENYCL